MPTWSAPPDKNNGDTFSEAMWDTFIKGNTEYLKYRVDNLDYVTITADVTVSGANEAAAITVITGSSLAYDSTNKHIEFWAPYYVGQNFNPVLFRGATALGAAASSGTGDGSTNISHPVIVRFTDVAPTGGTYSYVVKAFGGGTLKAGAGGSGNLLPAFLRVTSIA